MLRQSKRHGVQRRARRVAGFTLIESLVATTLLGVIVIAVIAAVASAQRLSFEGQKQILAALAANDLLTELATLPFSDLAAKDGMTQAIGALETLDGETYPEVFWPLGRTVSVQEELVTEPDLGIQIRGLRITVSASDDARTLATIEAFIPEPIE